MFRMLIEGLGVGKALLVVLFCGGAVLILGSGAGASDAGSTPRQSFSGHTWSIVAADPANGDVGVAVATCLPDFHVDAVAALVPGQGAAATQAQFYLGYRNRVFSLLQAGESARAIVEQVTDPGYDAHAEVRQYGVVTIHDGRSEVAAFTGSSNYSWAGDRQAPELAVTVQGNILVGEAVVADALAAFGEDDPDGYNALPDRLMRALEAGSAAGGDRRCNNDRVTQTAAAAAILVARGGDPPYATERDGETDAGTPAAPWLALSVTESLFGPNPLLELRRQYDAWRLDNLDPPPDRLLDWAIGVLVFALVILAVVLIWTRVIGPARE